MESVLPVRTILSLFSLFSLRFSETSVEVNVNGRSYGKSALSYPKSSSFSLSFGNPTNQSGVLVASVMVTSDSLSDSYLAYQ